MKKEKGMKVGKLALEVGAGLAVIGTAAAAGYYFYGSKSAKKHRQIASKWASDLKKEVVLQTKSLEKLTPEDVAKAVDKAARVYRNVRGVDKADLKRAVDELKMNWKKVGSEARSKKGKTKTYS